MPWPKPIRWSAVIMGVTSGLLVMAVLSLGGSIAVNLIQGGDPALLGVVSAAAASALVLTGYVAARLGGEAPAAHGAFAGLGFFALTTLLLILDGSTPGPATILVFGGISLGLGGLGGWSAGRRR